MTTILLVDTDVISFIFKRDTRAEEYESLLLGHRLAVSFMTVAELYQWAAMHSWGEQRLQKLKQALTAYWVIRVDLELCQRWGKLRSERKAIGRPISPQDAWIAATALRHDLALVTHNSRDYAEINGLRLLTRV